MFTIPELLLETYELLKHVLRNLNPFVCNHGLEHYIIDKFYLIAVLNICHFNFKIELMLKLE
jgi:hypothetical protein